MNRPHLLLFIVLCTFTLPSFSQDWWTKTKKEAIPADLSSTTLLIEKFKSRKGAQAPEQAYLKGKKGEHPLLKKTNDQIKEYNSELRKVCKLYKHSYALTSKRGSEDETKFGMDTAKYVLRHEVYLRKYQDNGKSSHFYYTYVYYFKDRKTGKEYPYIYLFEKKARLGALEELIGYLNKL